jgi:hypothetical protein
VKDLDSRRQPLWSHKGVSELRTTALNQSRIDQELDVIGNLFFGVVVRGLVIAVALSEKQNLSD